MEHAAFSRTLPSAKQPAEEVLEFFEPLDLPPSLYFSACVTEFLLVTKQFRELSEMRDQVLADRSGKFQSPYASAQCISVPNAFNSPLHSILNPDCTVRESYKINQSPTPATLYKADTTRMVCLFYIHATLWRYRHQPEQTDAYMQHVVRDVQRNGLESSKSLDALNWVLVWLCLSDEFLKANNNEMGWQELTRLILRLVRVARRLSKQIHRNLEFAMFESLLGKQHSFVASGVACMQHFDTTTEDCRWPDPEAVWKEFMG
ncbi:uncharacterized protein Z519_05394 [Cladophialophora bantiana CBS 173.52]|uniref:Uncharacterized protein n=1 Tax=Cladophialophora bantiana (strain ATCC 10958 / CBS 173.52 / CDC B-1940 / NIH 8579) TaxID=1442370 RepID=A0A0D2HLC4_CLAB1|nr:uncharacterized protein Z519_05394 [Cladophialophora bantiana CBS 173.52]KIW94078.1 hypothetical protein Z519_05394 [Cladophialophora bantiana CBS 173.52]